MGSNLRDLMFSMNFMALVSLSALSISFIVSILVYQFGIPVRAADYVRLNLFVTGCVALPTAIIAALHAFETRSYQSRLEALAWTDELTGLLNRRFFLRGAHEECNRMLGRPQAAAVAIIDLDLFKEVNDLYGHAAGDRVLKTVAQLAQAELRSPFDKLGRWGGEEFVVLLSDVTPEDARCFCERLRSRIETAQIEAGEHQVSITASFGFSMVGAGADVSSAIEAADRALYEAKRLGRNRVEIGEYARAGVQDIADFNKRQRALKNRSPAYDDTADGIRAISLEQASLSRRQASRL